MATTSFTLPASRPGLGSVVLTETDAKAYNVADAGVVTEGGAGKAIRAVTGTTQPVFVMILP